MGPNTWRGDDERDDGEHCRQCSQHPCECDDMLDPGLWCLRHRKPLLDGPYGHKASNCEDCEPPEQDDEAFSGEEAAAYAREQMAAWQRLK